jgi:hypothetical protein
MSRESFEEKNGQLLNLLHQPADLNQLNFSNHFRRDWQAHSSTVITLTSDFLIFGSLSSAVYGTIA